MISASLAISIIFKLIIVGLIFYVLEWGLRRVALPEPWNKVATVILVLIIVFILLGILLGMLGAPLFRYP